MNLDVIELAPHLTFGEFKCPCCGRGFAVDRLLAAWTKLRAMVAGPIKVTSGFRCPLHNQAVNGRLTSRHLFGEALDMQCSALDLSTNAGIRVLLEAGFRGIGRGDGWAHGDVRTGAHAFWKYAGSEIHLDAEARRVFDEWERRT